MAVAAIVAAGGLGGLLVCVGLAAAGLRFGAGSRLAGLLAGVGLAAFAGGALLAAPLVAGLLSTGTLIGAMAVARLLITLLSVAWFLFAGLLLARFLLARLSLPVAGLLPTGLLALAGFRVGLAFLLIVAWLRLVLTVFCLLLLVALFKSLLDHVARVGLAVDGFGRLAGRLLARVVALLSVLIPRPGALPRRTRLALLVGLVLAGGALGSLILLTLVLLTLAPLILLPLVLLLLVCGVLLVLLIALVRR